jgi:hypothetical protein
MTLSANSGGGTPGFAGRRTPSLKSAPNPSRGLHSSFMRTGGEPPLAKAASQMTQCSSNTFRRLASFNGTIPQFARTSPAN